MNTIHATVSSYLQHFSGEDLSLLSAFINKAPNESTLTDRKNTEGHITASGLVLNQGQLLLIHHPLLQRWIQPGGHIDPQENPLQAAIREVKEETHYDVSLHPWHKLHPYPFDIGIHPIPPNKSKNEGPHYHFDFRYLFTLADNTPWNNFHQGQLPLQWNCLCNFSGSDLTLAVSKLLFHENILTR